MANNNFYLNGDPLLFGTTSYQKTEEDLKNQLNDAMMKYRLLQQQAPSKDLERDYIEDLDKLVKTLNETTISSLNSNVEYCKLNGELQTIVQKELMMTIKNRINSNSIAIKNIERQIDIINETNAKIESEQRKNLNELNDYVKNYSNITFNEYKKIKSGEKIENNENTRIENKTSRSSK